MTDLNIQKDESFIEGAIPKHCPDFIDVKARYLFPDETPLEFCCDFYDLAVESKKEGRSHYILQAFQSSSETKPHTLVLYKGVKSYNVAKVLTASSKPEREDEPFVEEKIRAEYSHSICCPEATRIRAAQIGALKDKALFHRYYKVRVESEHTEQEISYENGDRNIHAHVRSKKATLPPPFGKQTTNINVFDHLVATIQRENDAKPHSMTIYKQVILIPL